MTDRRENLRDLVERTTIPEPRKGETPPRYVHMEPDTVRRLNDVCREAYEREDGAKGLAEYERPIGDMGGTAKEREAALRAKHPDLAINDAVNDFLSQIAQAVLDGCVERLHEQVYEIQMARLAENYRRMLILRANMPPCE